MGKRSELAYQGLDDYRWSGLLIVEGNAIYYHGRVSPVRRPHKIGALEIIFALDGYVLVRTGDNESWTKCLAVAIDTNQQRQIDFSNTDQCLIGFFLPGSLQARQIRRNCSFENGIAVIPEQIIKVSSSKLYDLIGYSERYGRKKPEKLKENAKLLLDEVINQFGDPMEIDSRVLRALIAIHNRIPNWRVKEIIEEITRESWKQWRSGRQLREILKSQIEVTFKEYLSLLQMREALKKIAALKDTLDITTLNDSIDTAVKQAGFYDQSHFNRTSLKMVGILLTPLIHNSQILVIE